MSVADLASTPTRPGSRILSVAGYVPPRIVTNDEICQHIDSTDQWIRERSGIVTRHFADADQSALDMAQIVATQVLDRAEVAASAVDLVFVASMTNPWQTPSASTALADRLGITDAGSVDVSAACSGFTYALGMADAAVRAGTARYVLVVGTEKLSDFVDPTDRSTAFIFGDGAGAALVGPSDTVGISPTIWGTDGAQWDVIRSRSSWVQFRDDPTLGWPTLTMQGPKVFRWTITAMDSVMKKTLSGARIHASDLAAFIPHQANTRIIDAMAKQLGIEEHTVVAKDIVTSGNTSAASIPLAMTRLLDSHPHAHGQLALLIGFGAGLTYAAQVVRLP